MKSKGGKDGNPKLDWIKAVTNGTGGASNQITEYLQRVLRLTARCHGRAEVYVAESRFVTGLGRSHPIEDGFAWHPMLGTPFLPGSSDKGLVGAWANSEAVSGAETRTRLLGMPGIGGGVSFLDAIPVAPVKLEADVMTPHYAAWDEGSLPGDWRSPTPIPFLATAAQTHFLFGLIPCGGAADEELAQLSEWLSDALAWAGAGTKTASRLRPASPARSADPHHVSIH